MDESSCSLNCGEEEELKGSKKSKWLSAEAGNTDTIHFNFIFTIIFFVPRTRSKDCCKDKNKT